jgi:16S rRNA (guanine966-N2)-methyltransferase
MGRKRHASTNRAKAVGPDISRLRIVGGKHRGRQIQYDGDLSTRPMKERVREAVFNLVGPAVRGKRVLDLFAGTGAMALEALSRGAAQAITVERRFPAADTIRRNAASLGVESVVEVVAADVFKWAQGHLTASNGPWLVFCCPPYALYREQEANMLDLIRNLVDWAPTGSLLVLEFDDRFDAGQLPDSDRWDVRSYPPAIIAILEG